MCSLLSLGLLFSYSAQVSAGISVVFTYRNGLLTIVISQYVYYAE